MAKKVLTTIKLQANAGQASPAPPVGPALGQHGINIMEFCKAFNAQTQTETGTVIPVVITVYEDRSFTFITKTPPAAVLISQAINIDKGSGEPNREKVGTITQAQLREIAERKLADLNAHDVDQAAKIIAGTARSMGVERGVMSKHGKPLLRGRSRKVDREREYEPARGRRARAAASRARKFDESIEVHVRTGLNVRHADEQLRGTIALPNGLGKDVKIAVFAQGDKAARGRGGRRRRRRRRGPRQAHRGRLRRLRRRDRDAGHDVRRRPARPHPRPVGQDAQPESRHGHDGRRQGRRGVQVGQGRVPHRPHRDRPPGDRQGELRRAAAARELRRGDRRADPRQAVRRQGPLPALDHARLDDGAGRQGRPEPHQGHHRGAGDG